VSPDDPRPQASASPASVEAQLAADVERLLGPSRLDDPAVQEQLKVTAAGVSRVLAEHLDPEEWPPTTGGA
jgi:hypothetical protein